MRTIKFVVDGQSIKKDPSCDFSGLVSGSVGYLKAKFQFSSEWHGCKKAASFWLGDEEHAKMLDSLDSCFIPEAALVTDQFKVSVIGVRPGYRITTNKTRVRQEV